MQSLGRAAYVSLLKNGLEENEKVEIGSRQINFVHHIAEYMPLDSVEKKSEKQASTAVRHAFLGKIMFTTFPSSYVGAVAPAAPPSQPLTQRQLECLAWISKGKSSTDIGEILSISSRTVDYHVGEICQRLDVRTRMQAVAHAVRKGWLDY